jgi:hypothetical protein
VKCKTATSHALVTRYGLDAATTFRNFVDAQIGVLKDVVESEGIDCEFELRRSYDVFIDEDEAIEAEKSFVASLKAGEAWTKEIDLVDKRMVEQVRSTIHLQQQKK